MTRLLPFLAKNLLEANSKILNYFDPYVVFENYENTGNFLIKALLVISYLNSFCFFLQEKRQFYLKRFVEIAEILPGYYVTFRDLCLTNKILERIIVYIHSLVPDEVFKKKKTI